MYYMQMLDLVPNLIFSALVTFPEGDTASVGDSEVVELGLMIILY